MTIADRIVEVMGASVFYHEAGDRSKATILMLDGLPGPVRRNGQIIHLLEDHFHVVAVHLPAAGRLMARSRDEFFHSAGNIAQIVGAFARSVGLDRFVLCTFNHDVLTSLRIAAQQAEQVTAIISHAGAGDPREQGSAAWAIPPGDEPAASSSCPSRPWTTETQLDLFLDLDSNLESYAAYQAYYSASLPEMTASESDARLSGIAQEAEALSRSETVPFLDISPVVAKGRPAMIAEAIRAFAGEAPSR